MNNDDLSGLGIRINDASYTVYVAVSADIAAFFPSIVPKVLVRETGMVQVRSFGR